MTNIHKRLNPTADTLSKLYLRSGNECAFPGCTEVLFNDQDQLIGQCCHIEAAKPGGERYNPSQTDEDRRSYDNLLFLCYKHHIETNDVNKYTASALKRIKLDHENRFRDKRINIHPTYVPQILKSFEGINQQIQEASESIKSINEKQDTIIELLSTYSKTKKHVVVEEYFGAPNILLFKGRRKEIEELRSAFKTYNLLVIAGVSGIGKTTLLANFLSNEVAYKVLWINCQVVTTKEIFFEQLSKFLAQEFGDSSVWHSLSSSSDNSSILKTVLFTLRKHTCCIAFDALDSNTLELIDLIKSFNEHLVDSKIVISTNRNLNTATWSNPVYTIKLKGLDFQSYLDLLAFPNPDNNFSKEAIEKIYSLLNGHPYLLKLSMSILQHYPAEEFLLQIKNQQIDELTDYIKQKAIAKLNEREQILLKSLSYFGMPFRFSIGEYILKEEFNKVFKSLRENFFIDSFQSSFFVVPEFIRNFITEKDSSESTLDSCFVEYLRSIRADARVFERTRLIHFALKAKLLNIAKSEAENVLSTFMGQGMFNSAFKLATELEHDVEAKNWAFVYYIQGRVFRFQEDYENALRKYNDGLKVSDYKDIAQNTLKFEKASILTYLSEESRNDSLGKEAQRIYEELCDSENLSLAIQSQLSLWSIQMRENDYDLVIPDLKNLADKINDMDIETNVKASVWQFLGNAYSKKENYQEAFKCFDQSIEFHKIAIGKFGMNTIYGLYHLYESYAWTYAKSLDYEGACELFSLRVGLCDNFELGLKKAEALFDYGFHLIMTQRYQEAATILTRHYSYMIEKDLIEKADLSLIHGTLTFAKWYSNAFVEAVELLGVFINSCYEEGVSFPITITEFDSMSEPIDTLKFFKNRMYILVLPTGKTFSDFQQWINVVVEKRPVLFPALSKFEYLNKN